MTIKVLLLNPLQKNQEKISEILEFTSKPIQIKLNYINPLLKLKPILKDFVGFSVGSLAEVSSKIFSHIDSKNLSSKGEITCDKILKNLSGKDTLTIDSISNVIQLNSEIVSSFIVESETTRFNETYSLLVQPRIDIQQPNVFFDDLPIEELLQTIIFSKECLKAAAEFKDDPEEFIEKPQADEAEFVDIPELYTSTYYYNNQWVLDTAADFIKIPDKKRQDLH